MFTGIVQAVGRLERREVRGDGQRLFVDGGALPLGDVGPGDSIAVNGVCLTVTALGGVGFGADASAETLASSTLGRLAEGALLNLEKALVLGAPLGGHLVSGHVDGVGTLTAREPAGESVSMRFRAPGRLARYIARKGSVCVDGVSLTVNAVDGAGFEANIVPHTLANTTLGALAPGDAVNIEVDMIARYLERLLDARED